MKRNLIIDGQVLQTDAWHRGMGKYTLQIIHELSEVSRDDLQISLIFNSSIECEPQRFEVIKYLCPEAKQYHTKLPLAKDNELAQDAYTNGLTDYIATEFQGLDNYYLITSPFTFDFFAEYPANCHRALIFYDLTPLLFWRDLGGYFPPHLYMKRFVGIYEADMIFSISQTTKDDLVKIFGIRPDKITNINGGFTKLAAHETEDTKLDLPSKFILCPAADLPHKNNLLAAEGFELFNKHSDNKYSLVITSTFSDKSKRELTKKSNKIIFTGNISDEELGSLYEKTEALLFASKYEGLGIPILDAVANNKPVVASKIPVLEEMTKKAFYFFDPLDSKSLADALNKAVTREKFGAKQDGYAAIMKKYTWAATCAALLGGLEKYASQTTTASNRLTASKKIALVCVNPGIAKQIGRLAEPLYARLKQAYQLDFFFDSTGLATSEMERPTFLDYIGAHVSDIHNLTFRTYRKYDAVIYILDDLSLGSKISQYAAVLPGLLFHNFTSNNSNKILKEVITQNQSMSQKIATNKMDDYDSLADLIVSSVENKAATAEETIIKETRLNHVIMRKLMARIKNEE
jgi:glycosyltransferase involved in cell wall biosynthesis